MCLQTVTTIIHSHIPNSITVYCTCTIMLPLPLSANDNNLTTYEVQYRGVDSPNAVSENFFQPVIYATGMTRSCNVLGLMAYSTYNVSVRATNQYGVGEFSEEVTVRTEEGG